MRVTKREITIGVSGFMAALVIIGGGLWWHGHRNHQKQLSENAKTTSNPNISLNQDSPDDSGGLNVSGQASSLGQLGDSNGSNGQSGSGGNSSGSSGGTDTSAFVKYDKYKNNKSALFGDIQTGDGAQLGGGQKASIVYKVWLTNGTLVDQSPLSSSGQAQPFGFTMGAHQVISGLEQGVYGMKVGGKRLVIVPPSVGYGAQGHGTIPANAVLIFEIQLMSVQ